jgi:hypothetical protein
MTHTIEITTEEAYFVANCIMYAKEHAEWFCLHSPLSFKVMEQLAPIANEMWFRNDQED